MCVDGTSELLWCGPSAARESAGAWLGHSSSALLCWEASHHCEWVTHWSQLLSIHGKYTDFSLHSSLCGLCSRCVWSVL